MVSRIGKEDTSNLLIRKLILGFIHIVCLFVGVGGICVYLCSSHVPIFKSLITPFVFLCPTYLCCIHICYCYIDYSIMVYFLFL
jgi:hypothetical protein